jgi:uncharacterized protein DUF3574
MEHRHMIAPEPATDGRGNDLPPWIRHRVYLGSPHVQSDAAAIVARSFDGFTILEGVGYWRGQRELVTVFEILAPNATGLETLKVQDLAQKLARAFGQESVLLTAEPVPVVDFVGA